MLRNILSFLSFLLGLNSFAQDQDNHHIALKPKDSVCLKDCLVQAHWEAHTRTFVMSTINEGALKDDYVIGSGAGIGVLTKPLYGFQAGVSGFFMYNLASSKIHELDNLTNSANRYEIGLFDIEDHSNKNDLDRLEELYLKYTLSKSSLTVGKMKINTPFLNPQDGRMRPNVEEGIWISIKESDKIGFNGGWITGISPRSTVQWFSLANSVGIYPAGVNPDGSKSDYYKHIVGSSGMAIANIYFNPSKNVKINLWNGFLENVMNTALVEVNVEQQKEKMKFYEGLIYIHQDAVNNGGNIVQSKTYINKGAQSNAISAQLGVKNKKINTNLNYTHITGDGRYLMPREWGRENFYTFLQRERNEGLGNVNAFMTKTTLTLINSKLKTSIGYGYYQLPDVKDFRLNKYGMPSYHQINFDAIYSFQKALKGLELKFLVAYKINQGETYNNLKYVYNKVNMINFNFILDFKI
ncbi:MAG: OprD family outer membrane porin [Bacteroidota bacterium]|nr:OprD family outer membrane porin [Bacteroidota bacterium]